MSTSHQNPQQPTGKLAALANLRNQIRQTLATKGSLSARELADVTTEGRDRVYRQCLRLEREGLLTRSRGLHQGLFCVDCLKAVTNDTYALCSSHDLRSFFIPVWDWELVPQGPQTPQPKAVN